MKGNVTYLLLGAIPLLTSCASQPIALAPVGPRPGEIVVSPAAAGRLQVFSETEEYDEDDQYYFPHSDYTIYTVDGKRVKHVWNHETREDETPLVVTLPAGRYVVRAEAELYGLVTVPVVVKPGQTTRLVLQPGWTPPGQPAGSELVQMPNGYAVGWRADLPSKN
jgi:hypothetical protein